MSVPENPKTKTFLPETNPAVMGEEPKVRVATFDVTLAAVVTRPLPGQTVRSPETGVTPPLARGFRKGTSKRAPWANPGALDSSDIIRSRNPPAVALTNFVIFISSFSFRTEINSGNFELLATAY